MKTMTSDENSKNSTSGKNNTLFGADDKERFLNDIKKSTRQSYERIFKITQQYESALDKDLNKFSLKEIETILYSFKANNRNTVESYGRIISSYLNWSVDNNLTPANVLSSFKPDNFDKYLQDEEEYFSNRNLIRHEDRCTNYQDAIILRLLFIGVGGKQLSEIRNLKKSDVDFEKGQIKLTNTLQSGADGFPTKFTERFMNVDERTLTLIEGAINQKIYTKRNGFMVEKENIRSYTDLVENDYVVRASITKNEFLDAPVDRFVIYRRIQMLSETLGADFTAKFIQRSGMIYFSNSLIQNEEELSLDDLKIIADKFNMKSYHNLKGFLTLDNIRKIYPSNETRGEK